MEPQANSLQKILPPLLAIMAMGLGALYLRGNPPSDLLETPGRKTPDFSFQDRSGRVFSSSELKGKIWVADFIFTHCAGSCPILSQQMSLLLKDWKDDPRFKLLSMTVDPERDNVETLRKYAEDLHAPRDKWFFLTGPKKDLYRVIREGFLLAAGDAQFKDPGYEYIHSSRMVLVDAQGMARGTYDIEVPVDMPKLRRDIRYLLGSGK